MPPLRGFLGPITYFSVKESNSVFAVHEDILCSTSKFFRSMFQDSRKPVAGVCAICHTDLQPEIKPLVFDRRGCGQNFHKLCMDGWLAAQKTQNSQLICPYCRTPWNEEQSQPLVTAYQAVFDLDIDATHLYVAWIYSSQLHFDCNMERTSDGFNTLLYKAYFVAVFFKDTRFKRELLAALAADGGRYPSATATKYVYSHTAYTVSCIRVRAFMVEYTLALALSHRQGFRILIRDAHEGFVRDVSVAMVKYVVGEGPRKEDVLKKFSDEGF